MSTPYFLRLTTFIVGLAFGLNAWGQSSAFTFQGRLNSGSNAVTGLYDFDVKLFGFPTGGLALTSTVLTNQPVSNGLFVLTVNLGGGSLIWGADRYLEISVRSNNAGGYQLLSPRQAVTPAPKSLVADYAATLPPAPPFTSPVFSGTPAFNNPFAPLLGQAPFTVNTSNKVVSLNADLLDGLDSTNFLRANSGGGIAITTALAQSIAAMSTANNGAGVYGEANSGLFALGVHGKTTGGVGVKGEATSSGGWAVWGVNSGGGLAGKFDGNVDVTSDVSAATIHAGSVSGNGSQPLEFNVNNGRALRLQPGTYGDFVIPFVPNIIGGFAGNSVTGNVSGATIAGGGGFFGVGHKVNSIYATVGGGALSWIEANSPSTTIAGGGFNMVLSNSSSATISGGERNAIDTLSSGAVIAGGKRNVVSGDNSVVSGGGTNSVLLSEGASILGGFENTISNTIGASVLGGVSNMVFGSRSLAAGTRTIVTNSGVFIWADGSGREFRSTANNQFAARALGGFRLVTATLPGSTNYFTNYVYTSTPATCGSPGAIEEVSCVDVFYGEPAACSGSYGHFTRKVTNCVFRTATNVVITTNVHYAVETGAALATGSGSWSMLSDRNAKENFRPVNPQEVLEKVSALPMQTWNYRSQDASIRHVGPTAQDFHAAFGVGENETTISSVDADGVALAAVQGLNQKLQREAQTREAEVVYLKTKIEQLEELVRKLARE